MTDTTNLAAERPRSTRAASRAVPAAHIRSSIPKPCKHAPRKHAQGLLVLLAGAEARGKDLLIATARRRYAGDGRIEFPARLATKASAHDAELIDVSRRVFRSIENSQGFCVAWQHAGARHGLTAGALAALESGRIVVLAVPHDAIASFEALWPHVEVVPVRSAVDRARPSRPQGPGNHRPCEVRHSGDIAEAVRRFHSVLDDLARRQFPAP